METLIVNKMARTLFVCAYADAVENGEIEGASARPGQDWVDIAPETPQRFEHEAWRLTGKIEQLNGMPLICLFAAACKADNEPYELTIQHWRDDALIEHEWRYIDEFGHCLAMQSLGHGVSWFDAHEEFKLKLPLITVEI